MVTNNVEFDGATFRIADVNDVDGKHFICVLDVIRYLGFEIGSSEYARVNNKVTTGFEYLQVKFEDSKRKVNIISVEDMRDYIVEMQKREISNVPENFSVKLTKLIREFNNLVSLIRAKFRMKEDDSAELKDAEKSQSDINRLEKELEEIQGTEVEEDEGQSEPEENSEEESIELVLEEESRDLSLVEISVRNTKINAAKFLIVYKQLDSYGKRHLFELLEESDREVIHSILDEEYFDIEERKYGKEYSNRN